MVSLISKAECLWLLRHALETQSKDLCPPRISATAQVFVCLCTVTHLHVHTL